MSDLSVIFTLIFVAASLTIYAAYWILVFNRHESKIVNRRLELSQRLHNPSVVLETLRLERGFQNVTSPVLRQVNDWLTQTGIQVKRSSLALTFVVLCLVFLLGSSFMLGIGIISIVLAVLMAAGVMSFYFTRKRSQRIMAFREQLPEAIDVIVRGVRVGLPFQSAVALVAREMADPIGTEFGMLADEIGFGLDVRTALDNLYRRVGQDDLLFLTVSVSVQAQTGGNLGEILAGLSQLMRNRAMMQLKVKALSAEGRASAIALSAFPFIMVLGLNFISPTYYGSVLSNPLIEPAIFLGIAMLVAGNFVIYRMVNFKY